MESQKVENWLSRVSPKTARLYRYQFKGFMGWVKENGGAFRDYTPDELVDYERNADSGTKYDVLELVQSYMLSQKEKRYKTKKGRYAALRSFFAHNRAELPRDKTFRLRGDLPPVEKRLTVENVRDICLAMNPTYRAIVLSMLQAGMGVSEFETWNLTGWDSLKTQLRNNPEVIKIDLPGRRKARNELPYYTFIGRDAIDAIRVYLKRRPEDAEAIFLTQFGTPVRAISVSWIWLEKAKRIGVVSPKDEGNQTRYGKNVHLLRSLFRSLWEKSPASGTAAEFMMGHTIDPLGYNRFFVDVDYVQGQYLLASPMLQIMSSSRPFGMVHLDEMYKLRQETIDSLQKQIRDQQQMIDEMMPAFKFAQMMFDEKRELERIKKSSMEP